MNEVYTDLENSKFDKESIGETLDRELINPKTRDELLVENEYLKEKVLNLQKVIKSKIYFQLKDVVELLYEDYTIKHK